MHYIDTRGRAPHATFGEVLLAGTAPGGGLWMPSNYPRIEIDAVLKWSYPAQATHVMYPFVEDAISFKDFDEMNHDLYTSKLFGTKAITPIVWLDEDVGLLQLSNGPTLAFKDVAMQWVARLMDHVLKRQNRRVVVVVATSGDTGGAAVEAFKGLENVGLVVLYPKGRVSQVQQRMMTTSGAANVHALAVDGDFDACQAMVKAMFDNQDFVKKVGLAGVNSINWARIVAQIVYWVSCGAQVLNSGSRSFVASVPSGNFGNAFSAYAARQMGMPIEKIVVATNQNDVLDRVFKTHVYKRGEKVLPSSSPSMDIDVSSNFERLLFEVSDRDGATIAGLYDTFKEKGEFDVRFLMGRLGNRWASGSASEMDVDRTIRNCHHDYDRIIDPHTAVGMHVGLQHREPGLPLIIAETARPEKFPEAIKRAIDIDLKMPAAWAQLEELREDVYGVGIDAEEVERYIIDHVY
jgi:threonine synthase